MIKINEKQKDEFLEFIYRDRISNLFYIGDYLSYGFDHEDCEFFAVYEGSRIVTCMMRYYSRLHLCGKPLTKIGYQFFYEMILEKKISGLNFGTDFEPLLEMLPPNISIDKTMLSVYSPIDTTQINCVEALDIVDVPEFAKVQNEVFNMETNEPLVVEDLIHGRLQAFVYKVNERIVSIASATAFTPFAAMIIGVGTLPEYRKQGFARNCVKTLCDDLYAHGRQAVLFYSNPIAGKMYHSLGFVDKEVYYLVTIEKGALNENN